MQKRLDKNGNEIVGLISDDIKPEKEEQKTQKKATAKAPKK